MLPALESARSSLLSSTNPPDTTFSFVPLPKLSTYIPSILAARYGGVRCQGAAVPYAMLRTLHADLSLTPIGGLVPTPPWVYDDPAFAAPMLPSPLDYSRIDGISRGVPLGFEVMSLLVRTDLPQVGTRRIATMADLLAVAEAVNGTDINGDGEGDFALCGADNGQLIGTWMGLHASTTQVKGYAHGAYLVPESLNPLFNTGIARSTFGIIRDLIPFLRVEESLSQAVQSGQCAVVLGTTQVMAAANASAYRLAYQVQTLPGSVVVYDRDTDSSKACEGATDDAPGISGSVSCPHAVFGKNLAPSSAFGGFAGSVYADTDPEIQKDLFDLFTLIARDGGLFAALGAPTLSSLSMAESTWLNLGFPSNLARTMAATVSDTYTSSNLVRPLAVFDSHLYYKGIQDILNAIRTPDFELETQLLVLQHSWEQLTLKVGTDRQAAAYSDILRSKPMGMSASVSPETGIPTPAIIAMTVIGTFLCIAFAIGLFLVIARIQKRRKTRRVTLGENGGEKREKSSQYTFEVAEIDTIDYSELNIIRTVGMGSFGEVLLARWRDSDVAVKRMNPSISSEAFRTFMVETQLLMTLRNPNVIQYIGTVVDPPCLLTEYMERGSLFSVLHNPAISIDFPLKLSWAIGIAEGMQFLHASSILHRDFKSLNILISRNWTPKISDFGLSTLRMPDPASVAPTASGTPVTGTPRGLEDEAGGTNGGGGSAQQDSMAILPMAVRAAGRAQTREMSHMGSLYWTAPEVLAGDVYTKASDVYSFGIVLWEIMSRAKLYPSFHNEFAVAVQVIRNTLRPPLDQMPDRPSYIRSLVQRCWHVEALRRPTFERILADLTTRAGSRPPVTGPRIELSQIPMGSIFAANVKLKNLSEWGLELAPGAFNQSLSLVHSIVNAAVRATSGFLWQNEPDMFRVAFQTGSQLVEFCAMVQVGMQDADWSESVLASPYGALRPVMVGGSDDALVGMAVGITVHYGSLKTHRDMKTDSIYYTHPALDMIDMLQAFCQPGQTLFSLAACTSREVVVGLAGEGARYDDVHSWPPTLGEIMEFRLREGTEKVAFMSVQLPQLPNRAFAAPVHPSEESTSSPPPESGVLISQSLLTDESLNVLQVPRSASGSPSPDSNGTAERELFHGSYMSYQRIALQEAPPPSPLVTPSPWLIAPHEIELEHRIGVGSYAETWRAKWRGQTICFKIFLVQQLTSAELIALVAQFFEYRRLTVASESRNEWLPPRAVPTLVTASGMCIRAPMIGFVTEFLTDSVPLEEYLAPAPVTNAAVPATPILASHASHTSDEHMIDVTPMVARPRLGNKIQVFRQIVEGLLAIHSQGLFHGALCPSNVFIDPEGNVSLTDYGFFDVRVSLQTATAVGDVVYSSPEVLLGEPMSQRGDIYALGMLLFGILTETVPQISTSSMESCMYVIQGRRPVAASSGLSREAVSLISLCWHQSSHVRPRATQVLQIIDNWDLDG